MEEAGLENMTENTKKEKVLSKEEIVAALNERHSPEKQKLLSAGRVAPGLADWDQTWHMHLQESESAICI